MVRLMSAHLRNEWYLRTTEYLRRLAELQEGGPGPWVLLDAGAMSGTVRIASLRLPPPRWRALFTSTHEPLPPSSQPEAPISRGGGGIRQGIHPRMIFVRPWDGIPSMAHAFAIVCEIERRFGKIQEFVVARDSEVYSSFRPFLHAIFSRKEDADAIPLNGKIIQVTAPVVDMNCEGGIGLDDMYVYLDPETRGREFEDGDSASEKKQESGLSENKIIDVKLERTASYNSPAVLDHLFSFARRHPPHVNNPIRTTELAHAIRAFGGFVDRPSDPQRSRTLMEVTVSRWSRLVKQPPSVPAQEIIAGENSTEKTDGQLTPEEPEIPWTPFGPQSEAPSPSSQSPPFTPLVATTPSSPIPPPVLKSSSKPTLDAVNDKNAPNLDSRPQPQLRPKPKPKPNSEPEPQPTVTTTEYKISKKQRMLNAARLAGAMMVEKPPPSVDTPPQNTSQVPDSGTEQTSTELGHDPKPSEQDNKVAARKWWKFFVGEN